MTKIAFFDDGSPAADVYLQKNLGVASTVFEVILDVWVTSAMLTAMQPAAQSSFWIDFGNVAGGDQLAFFGSYGPPWNYFTIGAGLSSAVVTPDAWNTLKMVATHGTGTFWDGVYSLNGSMIADTGPDNFSEDDTATDWFIRVGLYGNPGTAHEQVRIANVTVKNDASSVIFSDNFATGDFSKWDSVVGTGASIRDNDTGVEPPDTGGGGGGLASPQGVCIAFNNSPLDATPTWFRIDQL